MDIPLKITKFGAGVFTIDGFLSDTECDAFIAESEQRGYSDAGIRTEDGELL